MGTDPDITNAADELRCADTELHRWKEQRERVSEPELVSIAETWISYYTQLVLRWRTTLAALRRAQTEQAGGWQ